MTMLVSTKKDVDQLCDPAVIPGGQRLLEGDEVSTVVSKVLSAASSAPSFNFSLSTRNTENKIHMKLLS